ncbi:uncharacterized protein LOC110733966 [Chenopodium quinoa]|uniref:uncharacterized protein LOC110733966 n=1 Tax=Chenopodium quinoa TaxID=63459 RepID=UPI000B770CE5|nr:uncharacterized protein LOC110733966 [Chenopodium quinoa]
MALKGIDNSKAPSIDGFNSLFFMKSWSLVRNEVYEGVLEFFKNWIALVLYEIIDDSQAGFIPGKHIEHNILLATELIKGYSHKNITPRCMIKIDLKKAYDSVEWGFLESAMVELSFPGQFIAWVMGCVSSVPYSIMINGAPTAPFSAKKGLRQGDPMSPFPFAIGMEYLSRCFSKLHLNLDFNYHPRCERLALTHLMFADDLLMFSRADAGFVSHFFQAFTKFSEASGLSANLDKSEVYFWGLSIDEQATLRALIGVAPGSIPFRYLGVPLSSKKLTIAQCKPLIDKVTVLINGWTARNLTYAGRLQLIRSVLFGVQTYWAQIFVLPKKVLKEIEARFRVFLWTGKCNPSKKALVSWFQVCLPKVSEGWNLISLYEWNLAAITKLLWDLAHKIDSLWASETVQHLFFDCAYSRNVWLQVLRLFGVQRNISGFDVERNAMIFIGSSKPVEVVFRDILFSVLALLLGSLVLLPVWSVFLLVTLPRRWIQVVDTLGQVWVGLSSVPFIEGGFVLLFPCVGVWLFESCGILWFSSLISA